MRSKTFILYIFIVSWTLFDFVRLTQCEKTDDLQGSASNVSPYQVRLPKSLKPTNYKVKVRPVLEDSDEFQEWTFPGEVTITGTTIDPTESIVVHAYNLSVFQDEAKVKHVGKNKELQIKSVNQNDKTQTFTIVLQDKLMTGDVIEVFIPYLGVMLGKSVGLYGFGYPDAATGSSKMAAASQCQPYHAREIFPCFDEFHLKATFDITIGRLEKYQTFSNSKIKETVPDAENKGWFWDVYEPTPVMSTNLVNVVVVDGYTSLDADASILPKMKIKVWAPKSLTDQKATEFAASQTAKMVKYFQEYFDFPYPLDKLDSVLIWQTDGPAIEHWGSITYGVGSILKFPEQTPEWKRLSIASLIAHEIAHQWMGNAISVEYLADIWIHEGFADYLAESAVAKISPEFHADVLFINSHFQRALRGDQTVGTHPLKHKFALTKAQMDDDDDPVDDLTYIKGASLVRMMKHFLTESVFKAGLVTFLKKFAYKTINQDDLFETLNSIQPKPNSRPPGVTVKQIMDTWTLQPGYPIVRVTADGPKTIKLSQEKFNPGKQSTDKLLWWIPIQISTASNPMVPDSPPDLWLSDSTATYSTNIDTTKWIVVNSDAMGFFRTLYDPTMKKLIKEQLDKDHTVFTPITRSQILDDYFAFTLLNYVPVEEALELTTYLHKETELVVWSVVFNHLRTAINIFNSNGELNGLRKYLLPKIDAVLTSPAINLETDPKDGGMPVMFRMELLRYGCLLQSPVCHNYSSKLLNTWRALEQTNPVPLDLQPIVLCHGVAASDKGVFDFIKKMHDQMPPSEQRAYLFKAMGCSTDAATLGLMLEQSWQTDNSLQTLETMADNPVGKMLVFESIKTNFARMTPGQFIRILDMLTEYWIDNEQIAELEKFIKTNAKYFEAHMGELKDEIASSKANAAWMSSVGKKMNDWFESHLK